MTTYGIDAHLLLRDHTTGVPRYAWLLLEHMMRMPLEDGERVVLYAHGKKPDAIILPTGWEWHVLSWSFPRGWTHGRLSMEMLMYPPDVLFVPGHEVPALTRGRTRVVTTVHDVAFRTAPDVYDASSRRRQEFAVQRAIRRAAILTVPSHATKNALISEYHVHTDRVVVTPLAPALAVADEDGEDVLPRWRVQRGQYVLALGRLEKKKNTAMLIRAFAMVKRRFGVGHPLQLVLAGDFGYGEDEIRRAIAEENMGDAVRLAGYVSDRDASVLLKNALCFAFPSRAEGFGIPVLEAMEHGVPVIATDIPAVREVAGDAAMLVSLNDVAAFARAIETIIARDDVQRAWREKGRARAAMFSWRVTADRTWVALRSARKIR